MGDDATRAAACQRFIAACEGDHADLRAIVATGDIALDPRDMTRTLAGQAGMLQFAFETILVLQRRIAALEWKLTQ